MKKILVTIWWNICFFGFAVIMMIAALIGGVALLVMSFSGEPPWHSAAEAIFGIIFVYVAVRIMRSVFLLIGGASSSLPKTDD